MRFLFMMALAASFSGVTFALPAATDFSSTYALEGWSGTATCTIECTTEGGKKVCRQISASCFGAASYQDAQSKLRASVKAKARAQRGRITGSIQFSITKDFAMSDDFGEAMVASESDAGLRQRFFDIDKSGRTWKYKALRYVQVKVYFKNRHGNVQDGGVITLWKGQVVEIRKGQWMHIKQNGQWMLFRGSYNR